MGNISLCVKSITYTQTRSVQIQPQTQTQTVTDVLYSTSDIFAHLNILDLSVDKPSWPERCVDDEGAEEWEDIEKVEEAFFFSD